MNTIPLGAKVIGGFVGLIIALALISMLMPVATVNPGQSAVIVRANTVHGTAGPGWHFRMPLLDEFVKYDIQVQKDETVASAASADLQTVNATIAVNYVIDSSTLAHTYAHIGRENVIKPKVIDPAVQEVVKAATAKYKADALITQRAEVTDEITAALRERLLPYNILVQQVSVVNFEFSPSFNAAIEAKATAVQEALKAENDLARVQFEADQRVAQAQAEAEAIRIQAQAITQQGGEDYVALQAIEKWNGQGCTTNCFGGNTQMPIPFFNVNK